MEKAKNKILNYLRRFFFAGLLITLPVGLTLYLIYVVLMTVDWIVSGILPADWYQDYYRDSRIPGLGLAIAGSFFVAVGWITSNFLGEMIIKTSENIFNRMPLVRIVYSSLKQIFEILANTQTGAFRECVLIEYPQKGIWSIGFVTGPAQGNAQNAGTGEMINVFVPMALNPTCGNLLMVSKNDIRPSGLNVEDGLKLVVSAGMIAPAKV